MQTAQNTPHAPRWAHDWIGPPRTLGAMPTPGLPTKPCASCGRVISWRKKWERSWDEVLYCSTACQTRKVSPTDEALTTAILALLDARPPTATICPSEAARVVSPDDWRDLMEPARAAARRLVSEGRVDITQRGQVVDPSTAKGPIRIRRRNGRP